MLLIMNNCPYTCIDPEILPLVQAINAIEGLFTTFSCAGYGEGRRQVSNLKPEQIVLSPGEALILEKDGESYISTPKHEPVSFPYISFIVPDVIPDNIEIILRQLAGIEVTLPSYNNFSFGEPNVKLFRVESVSNNVQVIYSSSDILGAFYLIKDVVDKECPGWEDDALVFKKLWIGTMIDFMKTEALTV